MSISLIQIRAIDHQTLLASGNAYARLLEEFSVLR
jgi:hypothetical protein